MKRNIFQPYKIIYLSLKVSIDLIDIPSSSYKNIEQPLPPLSLSPFICDITFLDPQFCCLSSISKWASENNKVRTSYLMAMYSNH